MIQRLDELDIPIQPIHRVQAFPSVFLNRPVLMDIYLPIDYSSLTEPCKLVLFNDGQEAAALQMATTLFRLRKQKLIEPIVLVAIYASHDRLQEYGTAAMADYAHRGGKAAAYSYFITRELLPFIERHYRVRSDAAGRAFAGFSLGGLSAFDIVWHHPHLFHTAGIFSGSFWWRSKSLEDQYTQDDRIMHHLLKAGSFHDPLRFWFQAGTEEEADDRNNNGVIDVIDDILDLMAGMRRLGYSDAKHMVYRETKGGRHNPETWGRMLPDFLQWAFGIAEQSVPKNGAEKALK